MIQAYIQSDFVPLLVLKQKWEEGKTRGEKGEGEKGRRTKYPMFNMQIIPRHAKFFVLYYY